MTASKRLITGVIPYLLIITGLILISSGLARYIEHESVFSLVILRKDSAPVIDRFFTGDIYDTPDKTTYPTVESTRQAVMQEDEGEEPRLIVPFFYIGDKIGVLHFPSVDLSVAVFQGDREAEFQKGAGHFPGSYLPGQGGNILIGAHRTSHFKELEHVNIGDEIYFDTVYGHFTYLIDDIIIIKGGDDSIAKDTENEQLTLYTCYPFVYFGNAPNRYVLICSLQSKEIYR